MSFKGTKSYYLVYEQALLILSAAWVLSFFRASRLSFIDSEKAVFRLKIIYLKLQIDTGWNVELKLSHLGIHNLL